MLPGMSVIPSSGIGANLNAYEAASRLGLATNLKICLDAGDINSVVPDANGYVSEWKDLTPNANNFYCGYNASDSTFAPNFYVGYVGEKSASSTGGNDITIVIPTTTIEGDLVIVGWGIPRSGSPSMVTSGYTIVNTASVAGQNFQFAYKFMGATPDTTAVCGDQTGNTQDGVAGAAYVFRGVDPINPITNSATRTGTSTNPQIPSPNLSEPGCIGLIGSGSRVNDSTTTAPDYEYIFVDNVNVSETRPETVVIGMTNKPYTLGSGWTDWANGNWGSISVMIKGEAVPGRRSKLENFKFYDGGKGSWFDYANATPAAWMSNPHKDNAKWTMAMFYFQTGVLGEYFTFSTGLDGAGLVRPGISFYTSPEYTGFNVGNTTADHTNAQVPSTPHYDNDWNFVAVSVDEDVVGGSFFNINGTITTKTITYLTPTSANCTNKTSLWSDNEGGKVAIFCFWDGEALTQSQITNFYNGLKARFDL